ncbi:hydroxyacylglutathione hydrolase [Geminocystis sp. NIES-3708]|nr:hydroxyacylglutathione hydrolase [Geminocystis sp. NIES-3708]
MINSSFFHVSNPVTIAIVGGGFSGSLIATHLLKNATQPLIIKLIERAKEVGKGIAYGTEENGHLLNVSAGNMSAFPYDAGHLLRWLNYNEQQLKNLLPETVDASTFIPRKVYGLYIQSILAEAEATTSSDVRLEKLKDEVVGIEAGVKGAIISLSSGRCFSADKVILAVGNSPFLPEVTKEEYVKNAWSTSALDNIDSTANVLLVGSGLTMVDMIVTLRDRQHTGKIYAISRRGLYPQRHKKAQPYSPFLTVETAPNNALALLKIIRQEVKLAQNLGYDWRSVIDSLRPITQKIWKKLSFTEQKRFLRHVTPYWDIHRHRIAPSIANLLEEKIALGQLQIFPARIRGYELENNKLSVTIRPRHQSEESFLVVDRIINCTGIPADYRKTSHPLITDLIAQGLILPSDLGLGIHTASNGAVISADGQVSSLIYTIGTPRKGDLWETIAVPELRQQALSLAQIILNNLPLQVRPLPAYSVASQENNLAVNNGKSNFIFRQFFDPETSSYTYLIADNYTKEAVLVDSVLEQVDRDLEVLEDLGLKLIYSLETHLHADHITGAGKLRALTGCKVIVPYNPAVTKADRSLSGGETLKVGSVTIETITTPGHTASHITYFVNKTHLLTGDALFIRGCGRTDFQGGDAGTLYDVVTEKLFTLPDETLVYPAHDYKGRTVSTIGEEKRLNPRFANHNREQFITIMNNLNLSYPKKMNSAVPANEYCGDFISQDSIINNVNLAQEEKEKIAETVDKNTEIYNDYFAMYI